MFVVDFVGFDANKNVLNLLNTSYVQRNIQ